MFYKLLIYIVFAFCLLACSPAEVMYRQNVNYIYAPETTINYDLRTEGDSLHVYLKFADKNLFTDLSSQVTQLHYLFSLNYERKEVTERDTVANFRRKVQIYADFAVADFKVKVPVNPRPAVLQLKLIPHKDDDEVIWIDISLTPGNLNRPFILTDSAAIPLFRNHVNVAEAFWVEAVNNQEDVQIKKYEATFPAAAPPFSRLPKNVASELALIKSYRVAPEEPVQLPEEGLYMLTLGNASLSVVAEGNAYPELTTAKELIEPLLYITSAKERTELYAATETKRALDQFWLKAASQDKAQAKQLIKTYYARVKEANEFFNSHKAGWLTDRGMIYIVFGKPTSVNRNQEVEEWTYSGMRTGGGVLKFIFIKKPNTFTQNHYELIRRPEYEFVWYSTVEKWRKGMIQGE